MFVAWVKVKKKKKSKGLLFVGKGANNAYEGMEVHKEIYLCYETYKETCGAREVVYHVKYLHAANSFSILYSPISRFL